MQEGSGPSPDEWRKFRQQLISGGIKLTTDGDAPAPAETVDAPEAAAPRRIAPGNEAVLRSQSQMLYEEYMSGTWAHASPVEAGGLLLRMPLEAQLTHFLRGGSGDDGGLGEELRGRLQRELPPSGDGDDPVALLATWKANTAYCYRLCESFEGDLLEQLAAMARAGKMSVEGRSLLGAFLLLYKESTEAWQQVVMVLSSGAAGAEGVTLNRPLNARINRKLATALLKQTGEEESLASSFLEAFGERGCIYLGGPSDGAVLVHGMGSLHGAVEVAPGTGIYTGGERGAIEAVKDGTASPLDFRWFLGKHVALSTTDGAWRAAACARPVALKQCLGLPKPLWHEVMELVGGEFAALSRLEIIKRDDLPDADGDPDE